MDSIALWVKFPDLPSEYFDEKFLSFLGNQLGKIIRIDLTTKNISKGRFAHLFIEKDLNTPIVSHFIIGNFEQTIEYEGGFSICFKFGLLGHKEESCKNWINEFSSSFPMESQQCVPNDVTFEKDDCVERSVLTANFGKSNLMEVEPGLDGNQGCHEPNGNNPHYCNNIKNVSSGYYGGSRCSRDDELMDDFASKDVGNDYSMAEIQCKGKEIQSEINGGEAIHRGRMGRKNNSPVLHSNRALCPTSGIFKQKCNKDKVSCGNNSGKRKRVVGENLQYRNDSIAEGEGQPRIHIKSSRRFKDQVCAHFNERR
ncbi:hypothetical protein FRX31_018367 [Thalictrum thalictroides]|uniref:DUF4283 domain-containing protein n=1 Tax=Thalictrum thalictroides TaxID=46969 RepID=A0A7J6W3U4_THATH|nr:hypothetical protein FRX31_018367 [Thalictrum thalictroides]